MQGRARTSFAVFVAAAASTSGCQELVGIDPWNDGKGGASSASGVMASSGADMQSTTGAMTPSSADASSSSSGTPCDGCFGASCTNGECDPIEVSLGAQVLGAHISALAADVVVATSPNPVMTSVMWTLSRADKYFGHVVNQVGLTPGLSALASADPDIVYWASAGTLHTRTFTGPDVALSSMTSKSVNTEFLGLIRFSTGEQQLCLTDRDDSAAMGGIYCQKPDPGVDPTQIAAFAAGSGLTGDGTYAYGIKDSGEVDAVVVGADHLKNQPMAITTPGATALAYMNGRIYWLGAATKQLGWYTIGNPDDNKVLATNLDFKRNKIVALGQRVYVLTNSGLQRFSNDLEMDGAFVIASPSGPILDFAVDATGIYWVTGGPNASIGLRGFPAP